MYTTQDPYTNEWYVVSNDNRDITVCTWFTHAGPAQTEIEALYQYLSESGARFEQLSLSDAAWIISGMEAR